ncbi:MAG: hypothetical protein ACK56F_12010 [bacterium]
MSSHERKARTLFSGIRPINPSSTGCIRQFEARSASISSMAIGACSGSSSRRVRSREIR